jgi:tripartite-type tricarboxylate transporter receptor subunit TctC
MKKIKQLLAALTMVCVLPAFAQTTTVKFISGWSPGGPVDSQIRFLQKHMEKIDPSVNVIVEYKPGAAGVIAVNHFAQTEPADGTVNLLLDATGILITKYIIKTNKHDLDILLPIGHTQMLLVAPTQSSLNNIGDIKKLSKSHITYASSGVGSISHLTSAYLESYLPNKEFIHVPYKGTAAVYPDLITGRTDLFSVLFTDGIEQVLSDKVKPLAITGNTRHPKLPNIMTLAEQGIYNYPLDPWFAIFTHPSNNSVQVTKVKNLLKKILLDPSIQKEYLQNGLVVDQYNIEYPEQWFKNQNRIYQQLAKYSKFTSLDQK